MRNYIEGIPHSHREMSSGTYRGVTEGGLPFDLDVDRLETSLSTNGYARRMMELRIRAAAEARAAGRPLGVDVGVSSHAPEELTRITLRIGVGLRVRSYGIAINPDGSYSALSGRKSSLREMVREVASAVDREAGMVPARMSI